MSRTIDPRSTVRLAERHSATRFLNSLLREWRDYRVVSAPAQIAIQHDITHCIEFRLPDASTLLAPLLRVSQVGRHQYADQLYRKNPAGTLASITFQDFSAHLMAVAAQVYPTHPDTIESFKSRLEQSQAVIQSILESRSIPSPDESLDFLSMEQSLLLGHTFHPTPKSREPLTESEMRAYSPEFGASFPIQWWWVKSELLVSKGNCGWNHRLYTQEQMPDSSAIPEGYEPYPVHPWQRQILLTQPEIQSAIESGAILEKGPSVRVWSPTSSLRSLYSAGAEYLLKFSLSLRLTNSVRHLQANEVTRGILLKDVLETAPGREFENRFPRFKVIREPAFIALKDASGLPRVDTIVVARDNPFLQASADNRIVLATLAEESPWGGESRLARLIRQRSERTKRSRLETAREWLNAYIRVAFTPFIHAQADYGILLGAHQQNIILGFTDGLPSEMHFRDCQGTGYSELGCRLYSDLVPGFRNSVGNLLNETVGNHLFTYYVIINSALNVVAALADSSPLSEQESLRAFRQEMLKTREQGVQDPSCLNYLLDSPELMQKGNFLCSMTNLNENTVSNPHAIYNSMENPFYAV